MARRSARRQWGFGLRKGKATPITVSMERARSALC
jgi:hypothetical protein